MIEPVTGPLFAGAVALAQAAQVAQAKPPAIDSETLNNITLGLIFMVVLVIVLGIIMIHTYPGKIAAARNHPQLKAIEVTSLLGLIVFPLWMLALVWAYSNAVIGILYQPEPPPAPPTPPKFGKHAKPAKPAKPAAPPPSPPSNSPPAGQA